MPKKSTGEGLLRDYSRSSVHRLIGLMSGTSLDGVDAVLVRIESEAEGGTSSISLERHSYLPYSSELRTMILGLCSVETARIDDLVRVHFGLAEWYAAAVDILLKESGRGSSDVDAICMHGQTVWHAPESEIFPGPQGALRVAGTLQIGEAAVLAERSGIPVVSNLRSRDMAAGGEGAPLAPYIDALLFGSPEVGRVVQNIGGIGNATVLPAGCGTSGADSRPGIFAFDTGPGNMVIDGVVRLGSGGERHYDEGGRLAAAGKASEDMVRDAMCDPYFARKPPKSTGREVYGEPFAKAFYESALARGLTFEDTVATATAFTAESIARSYRDFVLPAAAIGEVLVCGGGALNPSLRRMIAERLLPGISVLTTAERGVPDQAREAMAFALLGHESLMGRPGNLPAVTGARRAVVLGDLTL